MTAATVFHFPLLFLPSCIGKKIVMFLLIAARLSLPLLEKATLLLAQLTQSATSLTLSLAFFAQRNILAVSLLSG